MMIWVDNIWLFNRFFFSMIANILLVMKMITTAIYVVKKAIRGLIVGDKCDDRDDNNEAWW